MRFGIMFFSCDADVTGEGRYDFLLKAARFADTHTFSSVWTPERHFHRFGGLFPNPALTSAALAMATQRIGIRAGSVVGPLHDSIRIAEEWAVVDNLSGGRVGLSFAPGWAANDFVFRPEAFANRKEIMQSSIDDVRRLWAGETLPRKTPTGELLTVQLFPKPVQRQLPIWVTSTGNPASFAYAGRIGAHILTHLLGPGQNLDTLRANLAIYHQELESAGHDISRCEVTVMLHAYMGEDMTEVMRIAEQPFKNYLRTAFDLNNKQQREVKKKRLNFGDDTGSKLVSRMLDLAFERHLATASLIGTPESCAPLVASLEEVGVTEIACLIDFGVPQHEALASLAVIDRLAREASEPHK